MGRREASPPATEFRAGERYRLGFVVRPSGPARDDWTGLEVELAAPWGDGLWRCKVSDSQFIIVSAERLRGSARLRG